MEQPSPARNSLVSLAVSHGGVDAYQGAIAALVPVFVLEHGYSLSAVAMIVLASSLASSIIRPLFGYLGDRWQMRWLVPASILVAGPGLSMIAFSPAYWVTVALAAVTGIGVAALHPSAAGLARDYLPRHIGTASGVTLGLTVSFGGLASPVIGAVGLLFLTPLVNPVPELIETTVVRGAQGAPNSS